MLQNIAGRSPIQPWSCGLHPRNLFLLLYQAEKYQKNERFGSRRMDYNLCEILGMERYEPGWVAMGDVTYSLSSCHLIPTPWCNTVQFEVSINLSLPILLVFLG